MTNSYSQGSLIRVSAAFTKVSDGTAADPDVVKLSIKDGSGAVTTYTYGSSNIVKDSTGNYHFDVDTSSVGNTWTYRWFSTGNGQAASERTFNVTAAKAV